MDSRTKLAIYDLQGNSRQVDVQNNSTITVHPFHGANAIYLTLHEDNQCRLAVVIDSGRDQSQEVTFRLDQFGECSPAAPPPLLLSPSAHQNPKRKRRDQPAWGSKSKGRTRKESRSISAPMSCAGGRQVMGEASGLNPRHVGIFDLRWAKNGVPVPAG